MPDMPWHCTSLTWRNERGKQKKNKKELHLHFCCIYHESKAPGEKTNKNQFKVGGLMSLVYQYLPYFSYVIDLKNFNFIAGKQLMLHVAELVPRHPGRTKKQEPVSTSNAATSKSGKGGKKKRQSLHERVSGLICNQLVKT